MPYQHQPLVDEADLAVAMRELGPALPRILGYYRQDGVVSITRIEDAMAKRDAAAMVLPAHTLKGESRQFGAVRLGELALHLEMTARDHVERREPLPDSLLNDVDSLRPLFHQTLVSLDAAGLSAQPAPARISPPPSRTATTRRAVFGRRPA